MTGSSIPLLIEPLPAHDADLAGMELPALKVLRNRLESVQACVTSRLQAVQAQIHARTPGLAGAHANAAAGRPLPEVRGCTSCAHSTKPLHAEPCNTCSPAMSLFPEYSPRRHVPLETTRFLDEHLHEIVPEVRS